MCPACLDDESDFIGEMEMKKNYEAPKAEKMEFDYIESVLACCSKYTDCEHQKGGSSDVYNSDPHGQYHKCTCTTYYAGGWGQNC